MTKTPRITPTSKRRVEVVAFPQVQLLDVAGPLQVFATANDQAVAAGKPAPYDVVLVSTGPEVRTSAGVAMHAQRLPRGLAADTMLVAGGRGAAAAMRDAALLRWLQRRAKVARRIGSVCTGAFVLGAAGLLDG